MKTLTVQQASEDLPSLIQTMRSRQEEVVLMEGGEEVARLMPEPMGQTADEFFGNDDDVLEEDIAADHASDSSC